MVAPKGSELIQKGTKTEIITKEVDKPETIKKIQVLQNELDEKINKSRMKRWFMADGDIGKIFLASM